MPLFIYTSLCPLFIVTWVKSVTSKMLFLEEQQLCRFHISRKDLRTFFLILFFFRGKEINEIYLISLDAAASNFKIFTETSVQLFMWIFKFKDDIANTEPDSRRKIILLLFGIIHFHIFTIASNKNFWKIIHACPFKLL